MGFFGVPDDLVREVDVLFKKGNHIEVQSFSGVAIVILTSYLLG